MAVELGLLGLLIGSHIAVMVSRWPDYATAIVARSRCDACRRPLTALELVPLASMIWLGGRCRSCAAPIPALHWRIELAALAIGVMAGSTSGSMAAPAGALFGWQLLAIACIDMAKLWLPDRLTIGIAATGLGSAALGLAPGFGTRLLGGGAGYLVLWAVARAYRRWRGHDGLGGGDPKLLGAIGCWLGWQALPALLLLSSSLGLLYVAFQHLRGVRLERRHRLPFGAMLAGAGFLLWLAANR